MISYLDNSATTRPADAVIEAMAQCMREGYFNPSSLYAPAVQAEKRLAACREAILAPLQAREHICLFTSGGTEANNLAILGSVAAMRGTPPLAVGTTEHPSVLAPFEHLQSLGYPVQRIPVTSEGEVNYAQLHLASDTALVSFMQVNNETGALLDVERFAAAVRAMAPNALIHIDGVQGFLRSSAFPEERGHVYAQRAQAARPQGNWRAGGAQGWCDCCPARWAAGRSAICAPAQQHCP